MKKEIELKVSYQPAARRGILKAVDSELHTVLEETVYCRSANVAAFIGCGKLLMLFPNATVLTNNVAAVAWIRKQSRNKLASETFPRTEKSINEIFRYLAENPNAHKRLKIGKGKFNTGKPVPPVRREKAKPKHKNPEIEKMPAVEKPDFKDNLDVLPKTGRQVLLDKIIKLQNKVDTFYCQDKIPSELSWLLIKELGKIARLINEN